MTSEIIGALRHRVTIETPTRTPEAGGTATITWSPFAVVYARIEAISGREIEMSDGTSARVSHRILVRWRNDVTPEMRIVEGARIFDIHAALDLDGRRRWLRCLCEERLP